AALERARECRAWLSSLGWPLPVEADSANGGHLLYAIDLANNEGSLDLIERCLKALDFLFSDEQVNVDTTVGNAARVRKLYGTVGAQGDGTPDRPHRLARLLAVPDPVAVVPVDLLESLAQRVPPEPEKQKKSASANGDGAGKADQWVESWIEQHKDKI